MSYGNGWQNRAACKFADPELFTADFAPDNMRLINRAKDICHGCPVRENCLEYALERPEVWGVWGGLDEDERGLLARRMRNAA